MLGKQRELVLRLQTLSEENRALKERWKVASDELDDERASKQALVDRIVPGAAAAVARCEEAERRVVALESQLQQAMDGVMATNPAIQGRKAAGGEPLGAGDPDDARDGSQLHPALKQAMGVRSLTAFASRWSVESLFPTLSVARATLAAQGVVLLPLLALVALARGALAVPVIVVPFSAALPGAWSVAWPPLSRAALQSVWLPSLGCLALLGAMAWAAAAPAVRRWAAAPLLVSAATSASLFWAATAWPVIAPLPGGAAAAPDGWTVMSPSGEPLEACPDHPGGAAATPCLVKVPLWSSPLLLLLGLAPGPLLTALRILVAPSTRRTQAWVVRRIAGSACRYAEAAGAVLAAAFTLLLLSALPDGVLASSLLQYNAFQHVLLALLAAMSGETAAHRSIQAIRDTVNGALQRPHQQDGTGMPGAPARPAGVVLPSPDFFFETDAAWVTLALYATPIVILAWVTVRVALHHAAERAEAAARPAGLAEHVSQEGDDRAARRALPPLVSYFVTHAALLAWFKVVAEPAVPEGAWEAAGVGAVSVAAACCSPILLLASVSVAIVTHRLTRDALPLNDPFAE